MLLSNNASLGQLQHVRTDLCFPDRNEQNHKICNESIKPKRFPRWGTHLCSAYAVIPKWVFLSHTHNSLFNSSMTVPVSSKHKTHAYIDNNRLTKPSTHPTDLDAAIDGNSCQRALKYTPIRTQTVCQIRPAFCNIRKGDLLRNGLKG